MKVLIDGNILVQPSFRGGRCISCLMLDTDDYLEQKLCKEDWDKVSWCIEEIYFGEVYAEHKPWSVELWTAKD